MAPGAEGRPVAGKAVGRPNLGDDKLMCRYPSAGWSIISLMVAGVTEILLLVALLANLRVFASYSAVFFFFKFLGMGDLDAVAATAECFLVTHHARVSVFFRVFAMIGMQPGSCLMA